MVECEKLQTCPFFTNKMANMPNAANLMKQTYCLGDRMQCARFQVDKAGIQVPPNLFPNDRERAEQILGRRF